MVVGMFNPLIGVQNYLGMHVNRGPFGGHHVGPDSCHPTTLEVVSYCGGRNPAL